MIIECKFHKKNLVFRRIHKKILLKINQIIHCFASLPNCDKNLWVYLIYLGWDNVTLKNHTGRSYEIMDEKSLEKKTKRWR